MAKQNPGGRPPGVPVDWRGRKSAAPSRAATHVRERRERRTRRWLIIPVLVAFLAVLVSLLITFVLLRPPLTPMYGLAITPYGDPIPPNAFASEDMDRFREAFEPRRMLRFFSTQEIRFTNLANTVLDDWDLSRDAILDRFDTSMKGAKPGGPGKNVVLLYLSAHGVLDAQGNACLLFGPRFGSTDEAGWRQQRDLERHFVFVPVLDIIQRCRKAIDEGRTPRAPNCKLVVFLDAWKAPPIWSLGFLEHGVGQALESELQRREDLQDVVIIGSARDDQIAWSLPEWERSVFAEAVRRGLLGEADGAGSGAGWNERVELRELVAYLEQAVGGWVTQRRSARQTPVMLAPGGEQPNDFALAYCRHVVDVPPEIAVEGPQDSDLWEAHDRFAPWKDTPPRLPPHAWLPFAALQRGLTRLEELRLAGKAYQGQADALRKDLRRLVEDLNQPLAAPRARVSLHEFPTDPSGTELLVNDVRAGTAFADVAKKREWEQSYRGRSYHDRAVGVWRHLVADGVAPGASVLASLDLVGVPPQGPEFLELRALRQWRENGHLTAAYPDRPADRAGLVHRAIIVRDKAQQVVNREDSRAFVLTEPILEEADRLRRRADDGLFHAATTPDSYRQAEATYDRAIQLQERVLNAHLAADRAFLELPLFERYHRQRGDTSRLARVEQGLEQVNQIVESLRKLHGAAAATPGERPDIWLDEELSRGALERRAKELRNTLEELHQDVERQVRDVTRDKPDNADTLRRAIELLNTPLVAHQERVGLHQKWHRIASDLGKPERQLVAVEPGEGVQRASSPMPLLLGGKLAAESPAGRAAALRREIPLFLAARFNAPGQENPAWSSASTVSCFDNEIETKRMASLIAWPCAPDSTLDARDPVKTHVRLQENLRYVFQANRAIEDFLGDDQRITGGAAPPDAGDPGGEFYCATAARRYLAAVEPAFGSLKDAALARCTTIAAVPPGWLTPALRVAGGRESTSGRPLLVDLRPKQLALELEIRTSFPAAVPAGTAALAVWHGSRPLKLRRAGAPASEPPVTTIPLPVGDAAAPVDLEVLLPDIASDAVELRVIVFYRNHASEQQLDLRPARQSQVARWERPRLRDATVIVERDVKDPGTACFILDCSASMETDLKTALAAATRVLSDLSDYHPRLSVWLFGHRIHHRQWRTWNSRAFVRTPEGRLVDQLKKPQGENVDISTDIAMVWKSGDPFGFREVLDPERVKPFGHTPLHLAMIRAMHEELESGAEPRRLVVLTDGADSIDVFRYANERFDANDQAYRKDMDGRLTLKAPEDVQRVWEDMPGRDRPQVFFLVAATTKDSEMTALRKLSDLVQGEVRSTSLAETDLDKLVREMNLAFGNLHWNLTQQGSSVVAEPKRINEQQSVGDRGKYDVGIAEVPQVKARVEIRGGEALRLRVTERRGQEYLLEHLPYEEERVSRPESVVADNPAAGIQGDEDFHPRRFQVSGLEPQVDGGNTVTLRVSIENGQPERFSPRPQWVWGEITPLRRAGDQVAPIDAHDGFLVADVDFEPGLPVPVLRLQAGPWPERVDRDSLAELKLWFSTRSVNPSGRQPLGDLESGDERRARKIPKDRDVTYRMEFSRESGALQVTVFERHPGPFHGSSYDARRVELSVPADEVRREYYPNVGRVNHVFRYADATEEQLRGALLEVYRVEDLKKAEHGTVECPEPLLIPLGRRR